MFGIILYRWLAYGRRVDAGLMARGLLESGFLFGLVSAMAIGATGALGVLYGALSDGRGGDPEGLVGMALGTARTLNSSSGGPRRRDVWPTEIRVQVKVKGGTPWTNSRHGPSGWPRPLVALGIA